MEPDNDNYDIKFREIYADLTSMHIGTLLTKHPGLAALFKLMDHVTLSATFGGLLTKPDLQSNCIRLEALVHLAVAAAEDQRAPSEKLIHKAFEKLEDAAPGRMEDPAEDVFVTSVNTPRGNFLLLDGVWEAGGFYTQRFINILEQMPQREDYD